VWKNSYGNLGYDVDHDRVVSSVRSLKAFVPTELTR
jgi:hypothetical protein